MRESKPMAGSRLAWNENIGFFRFLVLTLPSLKEVDSHFTATNLAKHEPYLELLSLHELTPKVLRL
jgi:hypothetical protein